MTATKTKSEPIISPTLQAFEWLYQHAGYPIWHYPGRKHKRSPLEKFTLTGYLLNARPVIIQKFPQFDRFEIFTTVPGSNIDETLATLAQRTGVAPTPASDHPLATALQKIRDFPANENSDPDLIAEALETIQQIASTALLHFPRVTPIPGTINIPPIPSPV